MAHMTMPKITLNKLSMLIGMILITIPSFAQLITIKGKVIDEQTKSVVQGVSVKIGQYGTSTDVDGNYVILVQQSVVSQHGVAFSSVGYEPVKLAFTSGCMNIRLRPSAIGLKELVVSVRTESIINKAIRKIPENYPSGDFLMTGMLRIVNSAKDSVLDAYFYKSDALLKLYYPGYGKKKSPDISLLHAQDTLITDPDHKPNVRWVSGYTGLAYKDYVHERPEFLVPNTKKYKYIVNGKDWINDTRVYVVNFFSTEKAQNAGTMYIDTANYAFVRITFTNYNIQRAFMINIDKSTNIIDYKKRGNKWFLEATETNIITRHKQFDLSRAFNFRTTAIDTKDVKPIPYQQILPDMMEDIKIGSLPTVNVPTLDSAPSPFTAITIPKIDTIARAKKTFKTRLQDALGSFRNYVINDNIREAVGLASLPLHMNGYQPILDKNIGAISNYAFYSNTQFRLIQRKELFLQVDGVFNFGIGGVKSLEAGYNLIYNFQLNKNGHPFIVSPSFGFSTIKLNKKEIVLYKQQSLVYGLNFSYEISPRMAWYVFGKYYDLTSTENNGLLVEKHPLSIGSGLVFKIKI